MQSVLPFLAAMARTNSLAFLVAFGVLILFIAPFIWRARRAERRYLLQSGAEIPASGESDTPGRVEHTNRQAGGKATYTPQEGGREDGTTRLSARQSTQ